MATDHCPTDSLQVAKAFRRRVEFTKSISSARPHPNPVAGTPSALKSPHPDRSDPDRAEPGHCRMPRLHRIIALPRLARHTPRAFSQAQVMSCWTRSRGSCLSAWTAVDSSYLPQR